MLIDNAIDVLTALLFAGAFMAWLIHKSDDGDGNGGAYA